MNNQAAQTMPELPEPELMTHLGREGYTADQMHQYARDYAAMLAAAPAASGGEYSPGGDIGVGSYEQTEQYRRENPPSAASVSERARELLAQVYDQAGDSHDAAYIRNGGNGTRTNGDVHIRMALRALSRVLATEENASPTGGSDLLAIIAEAIRNAERHPRQQYGLNLATLRAIEQALTQPSDAQRERDLLAEAIGNAGIKCGLLRPDIEGLTGPQLLMVVDDMASALLASASPQPAAEGQALTQQRGEPFAWAMTDHQADGPMTILTTNREDAKFWGEQGIDVEPLYKSPQPSADAVRELVKRWRDKAKRTDAEDRADDALEFCADELEAALTREAPTEVVGGVIVPRDPTLDMLNAGWREIERQGLDPESVEMLPIYHAMVTATPPAPQQQSAEKECTCKAGEGCTDSCSRGWRRILSEAGKLPPSSRQSVLDFICREMEKLGAPQRQSAKEVAIVCDWKDADPFPRFIEAEVDGRSVSLEWRDREDGLRELIVPAHTQSDYPGCSGDPASCPENEGYGCCKPNPQRLAQGECLTCHGRGEIGGPVGQTPESFDYVTEPCPECATPHPDALQDGTLSKSTAKRVTAMADASVSERARLLLADTCDRAGLYETADGLRASLKSLDLFGRAALRAIEQALTQQRGEFTDVGNWLWVQLMDWCRSQRIAPATQDKLFGIVERARKQFPATTPPTQRGRGAGVGCEVARYRRDKLRARPSRQGHRDQHGQHAARLRRRTGIPALRRLPCLSTTAS